MNSRACAYRVFEHVTSSAPTLGEHHQEHVAQRPHVLVWLRGSNLEYDFGGSVSICPAAPSRVPRCFREWELI